MVNARYIELQKSILKDLGYEIRKDFIILDFSCGEGEMVRQYQDAGFKAFGVDINLNKQGEFLLLISNNGVYRIPFDDNTFDFIFSNQVLEHVRDFRAVLAEIHRVLKPGGVSLHIFPPRLRPIEPHVFVPFGGIFQGYSWLWLWAFLGVRNPFQKAQICEEVARKNYEYLQNCTFYRSKEEIRSHVLAQFHNVTFAERLLIKHSYGRARYIFPIVRTFPFIASLYSSFHARAVFFEKSKS